MMRALREFLSEFVADAAFVFMECTGQFVKFVVDDGPTVVAVVAFLLCLVSLVVLVFAAVRALVLAL